MIKQELFASILVMSPEERERLCGEIDLCNLLDARQGEAGGAGEQGGLPTDAAKNPEQPPLHDVSEGVC